MRGPTVIEVTALKAIVMNEAVSLVKSALKVNVVQMTVNS